MLNAPALTLASDLALSRVNAVAAASALVSLLLINISVVVLLITPTTGAG